jgi:hypothetical protein
MFIDAHTHRLLAEERAAELRRSMGAAGGPAWLPRALTALMTSITDRRPNQYRRRTAVAGLPR